MFLWPTLLPISLNARLQRNMKKLPYRTHNALAELVRAAVVDLLNQNLADLVDLALQARQAHWNVKGPQFLTLHELFDHIAEDLTKSADVVAERAVQLGGVAYGTIQVIYEKSRMPGFSVDHLDGQDYIEELSSALASFSGTSREAIAAASKAGDAITADLFTALSRDVDKMVWLLEACIEKR
jgi:starvation-inducible DNA-binding protein